MWSWDHSDGYKLKSEDIVLLEGNKLSWKFAAFRDVSSLYIVALYISYFDFSSIIKKAKSVIIQTYFIYF